MVNFIPFTQTSSHELYGYFSDNKTNSRLKLDRLLWQYNVNINVKRFLLIMGKLVEIFFSQHTTSASNTSLKLLFEVLSDAFLLLRVETLTVKCLHLFSCVMTSCRLA